jgi:hypothetical protein
MRRTDLPGKYSVVIRSYYTRGSAKALAPLLVWINPENDYSIRIDIYYE